MLVLTPSVADAGVEATSIATWRLKTIPILANDVAYDSTRAVVLATFRTKTRL